MRESTIERYLVKRVKELGGITYKFVSPGRRNVPDRIVVLPGRRLYFVEVKATAGVLRPGQAREHARINALGFGVWAVNSLDEADFFISSMAIRRP